MPIIFAGGDCEGGETVFDGSLGSVGYKVGEEGGLLFSFGTVLYCVERMILILQRY